MSGAAFEHPPLTTAPRSRKSIWAGRILFTITVILLTMDMLMKVLRVPAAIEGSKQIGFTAETVFILGLIQLACLILYVIPRTAVLGAILWTGYFGGAVCTHVRLGNPLFTHILSAVYVAVLMWGALWFRDARVRTLIPVRR